MTAACTLAGSADDGKSGLSFHQHDESWLALATGAKVWFVPTPGGAMDPPASAYKRRPLAELNAAWLSGSLLRCVQRPGDVVYLPAQTVRHAHNKSLREHGSVCLRAAPEDNCYVPLVARNVQQRNRGRRHRNSHRRRAWDCICVLS